MERLVFGASQGAFIPVERKTAPLLDQPAWLAPFTVGIKTKTEHGYLSS